MKTDNKILAAIEQQNDYLLAIMALLARGQNEPAEVVLAGFGLSHQEVARVMSKKADAVRMLVKRHEKAKKNT